MNRPAPVRPIATGLVCAGALAFAVAIASGAGPSHGSPADGKRIFVVKCVACHKIDGSGGIKLTGNPTPNWRDGKRMADPKYNDDYLRDCVTNGKIKSGMVAWGKTGQLKPADIENLIAYIRTFAKR